MEEKEKLDIDQYSELLYMWFARHCGLDGMQKTNKILKHHFFFLPLANRGKILRLCQELIYLNISIIINSLTLYNDGAVVNEIFEKFFSKMSARRLFGIADRDDAFGDRYPIRVKGYGRLLSSTDELDSTVSQRILSNFFSKYGNVFTFVERNSMSLAGNHSIMMSQVDTIGLATLFLQNLYGEAEESSYPRKILTISDNIGTAVYGLNTMLSGAEVVSAKE